VQRESRDDLSVAAIQAFRETKDRRERAYRGAIAPPKIPEAVVRPFRRGLAVIPGDERNLVDLVRLEAAEVAILDQVIRVFVVLFVADVHADVVQDCSVLQPLALAIGEPMDRARLIEDTGREARNLLRVLRPVVASLSELVDAAPADVRIALRLHDFLPMAGDVIQHDPFAQRQVAERDVVGAEPAQQLVEEHHAGHREVGAARLQSGHAQTVVEIERHQFFSRPSDLLGRDATVPERRPQRQTVRRGDHGAEAQNGARRAHDAIEPGAGDLGEKLSDLGVDVPDQAALVAALERVALDEPLGQADYAQLEAAAELD
jgi:hypothetical protein